MGAKPRFRLMMITDRKLAGKKKMSKVIKTACRNGLKAIQIREKDLSQQALEAFVKLIKSSSSGYGVKLLINSNFKLAVDLKANGIHFTSSQKIDSVPKSIRRKFLIGKSVHSLQEAIIAADEGFDYLIFGPVFRTPAKIRYGSPQGLDKLHEVCKSIGLPVYAVGGITPIRAAKCKEAGAYGVASIREIIDSKDVRRTMLQFRKSLGAL